MRLPSVNRDKSCRGLLSRQGNKTRRCGEGSEGRLVCFTRIKEASLIGLEQFVNSRAHTTTVARRSGAMIKDVNQLRFRPEGLSLSVIVHTLYKPQAMFINEPHHYSRVALRHSCCPSSVFAFISSYCSGVIFWRVPLILVSSFLLFNFVVTLFLCCFFNEFRIKLKM